VKVNSGRDYKHLNQGDIPVYGTGGYMLSVDESLSEEDAVGIGRKGTIDKPLFLKAPFWTVDTLFFMTPKPSNELRFLLALSQGIEWAKLDESTGVPSLSKVNIENVLKFVPNFYEQTAIGSFFQMLDSVVDATQRKVSGLKQLKAAYLQQMFPQVGELVPRVRFSGFSDEWEMRRLENVVEKLKSYSLSRDVETTNTTGYRYIHYGDIHKQVADIVTEDAQLPQIKKGDYIPLKQGDLVLADASEDYIGIAEPCVILHEPKEKIIAGLHTIAIRPMDTNPLFLYYLFHTDGFRKFGGFVGTGLKVFGITFTNLSKYEMGLPSLAEQTAVGRFFYNLDTQIAAQSEKAEKLKQIKIAYLQKMFI